MVEPNKGMIIMGVLEVMFIGSLYNYINVLSLKYSDKFNLNPFYIIIPACIIIVIKWLAFNDDRWKEYIDEFDKFDNSKRSFGGWIVFVITVGILLNFLYSGILLRQMHGWPVW